MAFAAARMIMPKDKAQRKPSSDFQGKGKVRTTAENLNSWSLISIYRIQIILTIITQKLMSQTPLNLLKELFT